MQACKQVPFILGPQFTMIWSRACCEHVVVQVMELSCIADLLRLCIRVVGCVLPCASYLQGGYDHYMQKEIHEQPESLLQTMRGRVRFDQPAVSVS
jgi:hypothetical protein